MYLWGQSVKQVALSLSCAFAITNEGLGFVWGGVNKWWSTTEEFNPTPIDTNVVSLAAACHTWCFLREPCVHCNGLFVRLLACWLAGLLACLLACWLAGWLAGLLACFIAHSTPQ